VTTEIVAGEIVGHRFWRYLISPVGDVGLRSYVADTFWLPRQIVECSETPDVAEHGIHAFKTLSDLIFVCRGDPRSLLVRCDVTVPKSHGIVLGCVQLWGIVHKHSRGYRAQYAKPASFSEAYGDDAPRALARLKASFGV
jgi:hypothetical protein